MPRVGRKSAGGVVYHVLNRGNGRMELFGKDGDYAAFEKLLGQAKDRVPGARLLGYCLMPNHWHLVLWPAADGELSAFVGWLSNAHVRRWHAHRHTGGTGHVYQGRFKSFPVQDDRHLLVALRYVEANPLRAKLVERAEAWRWCSLHCRERGVGLCARLDPWPVDRPTHWLDLVNHPLPEEDLTAVRAAAHRGRPLGEEQWVQAAAEWLGLAHTLRDRGRPKKPGTRG